MNSEQTTWATQALERLWPRASAGLAAAERATLEARLQGEWPRLFGLLLRLYGGEHDFYYHLEQLLALLVASWHARSAALRALDEQREAAPTWFLSQRMVGGVLYVDRFSETLAQLHDYIPYFRELGLTYLHLMPLFAAPEGNSDGGYAVSSYRQVNPALGTMEELTTLADALRAHGISTVVDFVFNHTSDEHEWATQAREGDERYRGFYHIFPDRTVPDAYDRTLREIFPTVRRGSFSYRPEMDRWVWTTFNNFQWDLNYANPAIFRAMAAEMLFLANAGIEILRLDAVAFIWKRLGTDSENQPEAHLLIQAFNAVARIAAPSLLFKSEAIVHPDEVMRYIGRDECQLSYNPLLMALCWEALATREVKLLARSLRTRFRLPEGCSWCNYLRSHDDIGWTFDDGDARALGIDPYGHRRFLNDFYTGRFEGSFARGVPFQENPATGDARISGTLASLAGLEAAIEADDARGVDLALRRIHLLYGIMLSAGGIPLLYLGDEFGTLNDYSYVQEPSRADDSRWVHRPALDQARWASRHDPTTVAGRLYGSLHHLIEQRRATEALAGNALECFESGNPHVLGYTRTAAGQRLLVLANFSERPQALEPNLLRLHGLGYQFRDRVGGGHFSVNEPLSLGPYQVAWLDKLESGAPTQRADPS